MLFFLCTIAVAEAFSRQSSAWVEAPLGMGRSTPSVAFRQPAFLSASGREVNEDDDDDDEDDSDSVLADASLGDWRKFRASLIEGGLPGDDNNNKETRELKKSSKSVAAENEALLALQNEKLAEEYRSGVWVHKVGQPEVGGLLCRMPLEAELYYGGTGYWKEKLNIMLSLEHRDSEVEKKREEQADTDLSTASKVDR